VPQLSACLHLPGFRAVSFTLHTKDVLSTVTDVLRSCCLSLEHVKSFAAAAGTEKPNQGSAEAAAAPFYRPIKWDKTYYSFTGFRDPEQELHQAKQVEPTLRSVGRPPVFEPLTWTYQDSPVYLTPP